MHRREISVGINVFLLPIFPPSLHSMIVVVGKKNTTIEWDDGGKIDNRNKLTLIYIYIYMNFVGLKVM